MTLPEVNQLYSTDARCRELLERLRWPEGVMCPRCKDTRVSRLKDYARYECVGCEYQFTVTSGTIFHDSHLPLPIWFVSVLLLVEAKKGMSAMQLKRTLWGVDRGSYKTAWYLCHRIRAAMAQVDRPMLDGTVEVDETYVGGKKTGREWMGRKGHKQCVIGIRQRDGALRFFHAEDAKSGTLAKYINELKRGIIGTWHKVSAKHLQAYLNEMSFRFDRRKRPDLFLDTLRHMVTADPLTFERLTA